MDSCADLLDRVLRGVEVRGDREHRLAEDTRERVRARVQELSRRYPIRSYLAGPG